MAKKMLINATHPEENRVAIVDDGILTELDIEIAGKEQTKGNIYKATVVRVETGLQAAFVDYGAERLGFLQMGEIHPSLIKENAGDQDSKSRARINDILRRGQELLVQVVKEERGTKGAALTTFLSLPGRYMVLMPGSTTKGVSRKIEEEAERKKLKETMGSLDLPEKMGYIVRTAGIGQDRNELKRDFDYLVRVYENVLALSKKAQAPSLIYQESNLVIRSIRDYFSTDMDEVLVDDSQCHQQARDFFQAVMPEYAGLVKLHQERRPIFSRYQIEEQIETLSRNKVLLPSGGSIVIDTTEALVAIDVNSGKMATEQGVEGTAYKTNLEAAREAARQLRLRDLGGLIVLDFIDMRDRKHIRDVEKTLKDSLKNDKARVTLGRISQFGLLEMSRQRIKAALAEGSYLSCPHCNGSGRIKSTEAQAISFLRKVHTALAKGQIERVEGETPLDVAGYLLNNKREELVEMERRYQTSIFIRGRSDFLAGQSELVTRKREKIEVPDPPTETVRLEALVAAPAVKEAPEEKQEREEPVVSPEPGEAGKKKKRKRRKKKKAGEGAVTPETTDLDADEETEEEQSEETELQTPASEEEALPETAAALETAAPEKKKRRRNRKRKGAKAEARAAEGTDAEKESAVNSVQEEVRTEKPASPAQTKTPTIEPTLREPSIMEENLEPAQAEESVASENSAQEEKKKLSRRRRSSKKTREAAQQPGLAPAEEPRPKAEPGEEKPSLPAAPGMEEGSEKPPVKKAAKRKTPATAPKTKTVNAPAQKRQPKPEPAEPDAAEAPQRIKAKSGTEKKPSKAKKAADSTLEQPAPAPEKEKTTSPRKRVSRKKKAEEPVSEEAGQ